MEPEKIGVPDDGLCFGKVGPRIAQADEVKAALFHFAQGIGGREMPLEPDYPEVEERMPRVVEYFMEDRVGVLLRARVKADFFIYHYEVDVFKYLPGCFEKR